MIPADCRRGDHGGRESDRSGLRLSAGMFQLSKRADPPCMMRWMNLCIRHAHPSIVFSAPLPNMKTTGRGLHRAGASRLRGGRLQVAGMIEKTKKWSKNERKKKWMFFVNKEIGLKTSHPL